MLKVKPIRRDNIERVSDGAIKRMSLAVAIKNMSRLCYPEMRGVILSYIETQLRGILPFVEYEKRNTLKERDVVHGSHTVIPGLSKGLAAKQTGTHEQRITYTKRRAAPTRTYISKTAFEAVVREILETEFNKELRIQSTALLRLQHMTEGYCINLLERVKIISINANRKTVQPKDIQVARRVRDE